MIFNKSEAYATVWKVIPAENGKYIDLQVSTSEKNKDDDTFINSSWFPRAIGHAANSLKDVKERDRIKITSSKFTNEYNKEKEKSFFKFLILEAEIITGNNDGGKQEVQKKTDAKGKAQSKVDESDPW